MATEVSVLNKTSIDRSYDSAIAGALHNNINALTLRLREYQENIQALINAGNLDEQKANTLKAQVDELLTKIDSLDVLEGEWLGKKAIATTFNHSTHQPIFDGIYSELTNSDFSKGSICFIITN